MTRCGFMIVLIAGLLAAARTVSSAPAADEPYVPEPQPVQTEILVGAQLPPLGGRPAARCGTRS